jgi:hypothetical protein
MSGLRAGHGAQVRPSCIMVYNTSLRLRYYCYCTDTRNHAIIKNRMMVMDRWCLYTALYIVTIAPTLVPHHLVTWHQEKCPTPWTASGRRSSLPLPSVIGRCQVTVPQIPSTSTVEPPFCLHALHNRAIDLQQILGSIQHSRGTAQHGTTHKLLSYLISTDPPFVLSALGY